MKLYDIFNSVAHKMNYIIYYILKPN